MSMIMAEKIKLSMLKTDNARKFMNKMNEYFQSDLVDKCIVEGLMSEQATEKFNWSRPIDDHVIDMQT